VSEREGGGEGEERLTCMSTTSATYGQTPAATSAAVRHTSGSTSCSSVSPPVVVVVVPLPPAVVFLTSSPVRDTGAQNEPVEAVHGGIWVEQFNKRVDEESKGEKRDDDLETRPAFATGAPTVAAQLMKQYSQVCQRGRGKQQGSGKRQKTRGKSESELILKETMGEERRTLCTNFGYFQRPQHVWMPALSSPIVQTTQMIKENSDEFSETGIVQIRTHFERILTYERGSDTGLSSHLLHNSMTCTDGSRLVTSSHWRRTLMTL
jgi:hypothetical protein